MPRGTPRKPKVIWTVLEEADWYTAFITELQKRKVPQPATAVYLRDIMEAAREAVKVIKVERRREFSSVDGIRGELGKRLVDNGYFPRNYLKTLRRSYAKKEAPVDPRDEKILELETLVKQYEEQAVAQGEHRASLLSRIHELEKQPTPLQLLQKAVAETLAMALTMAEDSKKPGGFMRSAPAQEVQQEERRKFEEPIPAFDRERRKDPTPTPGTGDMRPRFALIADFVGPDKAFIHKECSNVANLRYLDAVNKFGGLKMFNGNGGRIIVWAEHAKHSWDGALNNMGVSFHRFRGSLPQLVQYIRGEAARLRGPSA